MSSAPFSRTAARSSSIGVDGGAVDGRDDVALLEHARGRGVVEDAGDRDVAREVVAELDERRRDRVLLRVDHRRRVLGVAIGVADARAGRSPRPARPSGCGSNHVPSTSSQLGVCPGRPSTVTVSRLSSPSVGKVSLVGDLDERDLLALVLRDAERVVDGTRLLDHVRRRQQREAHARSRRRRRARPSRCARAGSGPAGAATGRRRRGPSVVPSGRPSRRVRAPGPALFAKGGHPEAPA